MSSTMDGVSKEILPQILNFLPTEELLRTVPFVSKQFHSVVDNDQFWLTKQVANTSLTRHQVQRLQLYNEHRAANQEIPPCLDEGNVFISRQTASLLRRGGTRRACVASSTDHLQEQLESCLMEPGEESLMNQSGDRTTTTPTPWIRWWSSRPAPSDQTSDTLLFSCRYRLASFKGMYMKPLQDPYYENGPIYTWRKSILRVYNLPLDQLLPPDATASTPCSFPLAEGQTAQPEPQGHRIINVAGGFVLENSPTAPSDTPTIEAVLKGHEPVHEQEHAVPDDCNGNDVLSYSFPEGVIGNVVAVELVGKRHEQRTGSGYFACIERVECIGIPLYATADDAVLQEADARFDT